MGVLVWPLAAWHFIREWRAQARETPARASLELSRLAMEVDRLRDETALTRMQHADWSHRLSVAIQYAVVWFAVLAVIVFVLLVHGTLSRWAA